MNTPPEADGLSRRTFVRHCALGLYAMTSGGILGCRTLGTALPRGAARLTIPLVGGWEFDGKYDPAVPADQSSHHTVTLPHIVTALSWQNWDPAAWQEQWLYQRHFSLPATAAGRRTFLYFEGVMVGVSPVINGRELPAHLGGYLPFRYEITNYVRPGDNLLTARVDARWSNTPPEGAPIGARRVDYLEPGGIHRPVRLEIVPAIYIKDVFVKPVDVLEPRRRLDFRCVIDAAVLPDQPLHLRIEMRRGAQIIKQETFPVPSLVAGENETSLSLSNLGNVALWDVENPQLYDIVATLYIGETPTHDFRVSVGLREARFQLDGFFLNGRRLQLFGLNRHELFPYVGAAMPRRVMRRDAEILRHDFNCNVVRCSHYPQSEAFLNACDEMGLMVWEEAPGWGYIGDAVWKQRFVEDVRDMIIRDRNHPAIIIWGTRVNESPNDVELYRQTKELAKSLDGSRPTSGSMTGNSRKTWETTWHEDVFAFDDYHAEPDGSVGIEKPVEGVPYMLAETVGQFNYSRRKDFDAKYRRAGDAELQELQGLRHAQAHSRAGMNPRICGAIAWCGFDYASLINAYNNVKCPGVADVFRIPKLGAAFYRTQGDPKVEPRIEPNFFWDFGPQSPRGPGKNAAIFSNCERLEVFINGQKHADLQPDAEHYPNLRHPPFVAHLDLDGAGHPELRIDGYVNGRVVLSRSFSSDPEQDQFSASADDLALVSDGADATRLVFKVVDKFGADRFHAGGQVIFTVNAIGQIVGDNPFALEPTGGVGAVWIKSRDGVAGQIVVTAQHSRYGEKTILIKAEMPPVT